MMKEKALKDVTNKLEPKPAKLKPIWAGVKSANGMGSKAVGCVNKWVSHGPNASPGDNGLKANFDGMLKGGPLPSRPPDPTLIQQPHKSGALVSVKTSSTV